MEENEKPEVIDDVEGSIREGCFGVILKIISISGFIALGLKILVR